MSWPTTSTDTSTGAIRRHQQSGYNSVPQEESAQYPSLQEFMSFSLKDRDYTPSFTNLFSFHIATPPILKNRIGITVGHDNTLGQRGSNLVSDLGKLKNSLNYYCQTVTVPSKQTTTGGIVNVASS